MLSPRRKIVEVIERNLAAFDLLIAASDRNTEVLQRNSEAFERNSKAFERNSEAFERNSEALDRHAATVADLRRFIRETSVRNERVWRSVLAELDDIREETRAQTQALLRILDRMQNGEGGSASA